MMEVYATFTIGWCTVGIPLLYAYLFFCAHRAQFERLLNEEQHKDLTSRLDRATKRRPSLSTKPISGSSQNAGTNRRASLSRSMTRHLTATRSFKQADANAELPKYLQDLVSGCISTET